MMPDTCTSLILHARRWRHIYSAAALMRLRHLDGCILSMEQSGTHWMRYLLGLAMAET